MYPSEHMRPMKPAKYAYPGDRYDSRAIISVSLLVGRRYCKKMTDNVNHIIARIEDDIYFVLDLS